MAVESAARVVVAGWRGHQRGQRSLGVAQGGARRGMDAGLGDEPR